MRLPPGLCPGPRWGAYSAPRPQLEKVGLRTNPSASPHFRIRIYALGMYACLCVSVCVRACMCCLPLLLSIMLVSKLNYMIPVDIKCGVFVICVVRLIIVIFRPWRFSRIRLNSLRDYLTGYGQIAHNNS